MEKSCSIIYYQDRSKDFEKNNPCNTFLKFKLKR